MKALILAAGFGTRLQPYTNITPKCLFPIDGRPLLDFIICNLHKAGCREIIVNTHHLPQKIETFIASQNYRIPVSTRYESQILGTGGAIKNAADFWDDNPFMVINSDIFTDISLKAVYELHLQHPYPATLVLCDDPEFNTVQVDPDGFVIAFENSRGISSPQKNSPLTFTGIQVLDPEVLALIPDNCFSGSIDMYKKLLSSHRKLKAFLAPAQSWKDIGTPERYRQTVLSRMAPRAFQRAFGKNNSHPVDYSPLAGDGSDRKWYRVSAGPRTLILADHGIRKQDAPSEVDAFVIIGRHLFESGIPVPEIFLSDAFSGLVFLEDLGDVSLQSVVRSLHDSDAICDCYQAVIDILVKLSIKGAVGFDPGWTYQTSDYNRTLILEKECRYFVDTFLNGYLNRSVSFTDLADEFSALADNALQYAVTGLMHRDLQSRNIMVKNNRYYLIDFQGGRFGPVQYDLASLMIDPYVDLPRSIQDKLLSYCFEQITAGSGISRDAFYKGYRYCTLTRNLQMLGAFGYLSRQKGKTYFEAFIPPAVQTLKHTLSMVPEEFPLLRKIVENI
ncbi:MAG: sugar phosphate nucleotidyltransferase [Desulfobacterales bacterium]|nr:sugar phosphate nucleotidyltransferase [Desulfobacterales bacterium]